MRELCSVINPKELRWIWITHADIDHLGSLETLLDEAPNARIVTTYLGLGKMSLLGLPPERMYLLNPGQSLDVGDRILHAIKPPTFDAPETTGLFDGKTRTFFSADCFGALLDEPAENAADITPQKLRDGGITWASIDAPWLGIIDPVKFGKALSEIEHLNADTILSAHLPAARGMTRKLLGNLAEALQAPTFFGPDQQALEKMLAA
jgi:glyoxylase-like metal-dependent hydrolase (beta-lactamase superfamily II)